MLEQMGERGPDSAGVAFYSDGISASKVTVQHDCAEQIGSVAELVKKTYPDAQLKQRGTHLVIESSSSPSDMEQWVREAFPDVRVMSAGERIEIYKEKGHPSEFVSNYALGEVTGSHALAHTRMATESAITTSHSHPFLSLIHI